MKSRAFGFVSLLGVIAASIVLGVLVGGRLNAPQIALAAPPGPTYHLAAGGAGAAGAGTVGFADIVEAAMPAVVSVTSKQLGRGDAQGEDAPSDPLWEWFFGPRDRDNPHRDLPQRPQIGEGSGFIISQDGYVLTNNHVIEGADRVQVGLQDGRSLDAEVVGTDPSIDLALLKIDAPDGRLPYLPLGDSASLRVGEWVIAIGNPLEFAHTVTVGVVSAKERRVPIGSTDSGVVSFIQTDAAINFGNSGGPLLDSRGSVVGINTAIRRANLAEGIGFALPINQARNSVEQLRSNGSVRRGYIGINMNTAGIDDTVREYFDLPDSFGVLVDGVTDGGPAERAGLRRGDVIRKVDGETVRDNLDLIEKISSRKPGTAVDLEILREGRTLRKSVTLEDRDEGLRAQAGSRGGDEAPGPEGGPDEPQEASGLGFTIENITPRMRDALGLDRSIRGVIVTAVEFDSRAADKGIAPNMVVTAVNDKPVTSVADWSAAIGRLEPGDPVKLDVFAGNRTVSIFLRVPDAEP